MRIEQIWYLIEISKNKSMSEASQKIHMTPQALSISIKNLEEELGIQLLKRTNKGTMLTEKGWALVRLTNDYLKAIDQLVDKHKQQPDILGYEGRIDIYSNFGGAETFLPKLIGHCYQYAPKLELKLHALPYYEAMAKVSREEIPYAFFIQYFVKNRPGIVLEQDVNFYPLFSNQLVCLVPDKFPIAKYESLTMESVLHYPIIDSLIGGNSAMSLLEFLHPYGNPPKIYKVERRSMVQELLASGIGIAIRMVMPYNDPDQFHLKNVKIIPIVDDFESYFGYIAKSETIPTPNQMVLDFIKTNLFELLTEH